MMDLPGSMAGKMSRMLAVQAWRLLWTFFSDTVQTGAVNGIKKTGPEGFHLAISIIENKFRANGTLETVIDGMYRYSLACRGEIALHPTSASATKACLLGSGLSS